MELRGTGDFFGTKQHGIPDFKISNLFVDMPILKNVQALALSITSKDPILENEENQKLKKLIDKKFKGRIEI